MSLVGHALAAALLAAAVACGASSRVLAQDAALAAAAERAARLAQDVERLEAEDEIENLQRIYGFYTDKQLWSAASELFADGGTIEIGGAGVYAGRQRVLEYLRTHGPETPQPNRLFDQMQLQPIVTVAPGAQTAKARWRMFAQEARHGEYADWGAGIYENEYVKENGVWKIAKLRLYTTFYTPYEEGWAKTALPERESPPELPPDRPPSAAYGVYPEPFVPPFHYANPVSGATAATGGPPPANAGTAAGTAGTAASRASTATGTAGTPAGAAALTAALDALERRIGLLEDAAQIERLNAVYGYYLAHKNWDDLAGIFAPDGTIEIALRGVYAGQPSVRRNLNLYNEEGDRGMLHNHMQYQPVIHVAADGQTARLRSRAFSIMGRHGVYSMWMGGVYENTFVKHDGVWKIKTDRVFNTYFVPYALGWKSAMPRPPPGINASNPPDAPPSSPFEMYPSPFLPPYHYAHPVTGRAVTLP